MSDTDDKTVQMQGVQGVMQGIEAYFGPYKRKYVQRTVEVYLEREIDPKRLKELWRALTYHCGTNFGPPGVHEIEEAIKQHSKDRGIFLKKLEFSKKPEQIEAEEKAQSEKDRREVMMMLDEFVAKHKRGGTDER